MKHDKKTIHYMRKRQFNMAKSVALSAYKRHIDAGGDIVLMTPMDTWDDISDFLLQLDSVLVFNVHGAVLNQANINEIEG